MINFILQKGGRTDMTGINDRKNAALSQLNHLFIVLRPLRARAWMWWGFSACRWASAEGLIFHMARRP